MNNLEHFLNAFTVN